MILCTFGANSEIPIKFIMEQIKRTLRDSAKARWTMMFIISFLMAANYYFYDALSPLKEILTEHLNFSSGDYGIVTGFYAFPNTFLLMAIIGGIILDKLGIRPTGFMFAVLMLIGAALTAYGASNYYSSGGIGYEFMGSFWKSYSPELKMMSLGMLIFGLGAETSIVVASKVLVKWFKGYEIALAFALNLGIARIGTALAFNLSPRLIFGDNWQFPIWFAVMILLIGFLGFLIYIMYDVKLDRQMKSNIKLMDKEDEFHIADIGRLLTNKSFLFITALCVTFYAGVFPFLKFAPDLFYNKYGFSLQASGDIASLLPYGTVLFTPIFGWVVDKWGKSATLMIYGSLLLLIVHLLFGLTRFDVYLLMVLLGIAVSLVPAAMWPSVAKIVPTSRIGSAYGTMFSLQNLGLFAVPILAGVILDSTNKYSDTYLKPTQVKEVFAENYELQSSYYNNDKEPITDKDLRATVYILTIPDKIEWQDKEENIIADTIQKYSKTVWSEYDSTQTNNKGKFDIFFGKGNLLKLNMQYMNIPSGKYLMNISTEEEENEPAVTIYKGLLIFDRDSLDRIPLEHNLSDELLNKIDETGFDINIVVRDTANNANITVLKESHEVKIKNNKIDFKLGKGNIAFANINYLNSSKPNEVYFIKVRTPLDYTYTCLLFALFGIIGFFFALLLKHNDRTSGYGLELPSNATEEEIQEKLKKKE